MIISGPADLKSRYHNLLHRTILMVILRRLPRYAVEEFKVHLKEYYWSSLPSKVSSSLSGVAITTNETISKYMSTSYHDSSLAFSAAELLWTSQLTKIDLLPTMNRGPLRPAAVIKGE